MFSEPLKVMSPNVLTLLPGENRSVQGRLEECASKTESEMYMRYLLKVREEYSEVLLNVRKSIYR